MIEFGTILRAVSDRPYEIERYRAGQGKNDNTYKAHDLKKSFLFFGNALW